MASPAEHAQIVLSAILPHRRDLLEQAASYLTPESFPEPPQANLFKFLVHYSDRTGGAVLPLKYLSDVLRDKTDAGRALQYEELWQACADTSSTDDEFAWSMEQLRENTALQRTGEALAEGMEILRTGKLEGAETIKGHAAARLRIMESFQEIDREITRQEAPEGDLKNEFNELMEDYAKVKTDRVAGRSVGIKTGVEEIDRKVGGFQPGELVLVIGYSSDGKSSFAVQCAWSAAIEQKKNVVFLTTETLRNQIRRKIVSRHSKLSQFHLPDGLNSWDLKSGTLTEDQEHRYQDVVRDLTKNPAYGHLYVAQVPRAATLASIDMRLHRINRQFPIDFVVLDYLALLGTEQRTRSLREDMSDLLKGAKLLSVNFDSGRGVPFLTPWQVNRESRDKAETDGRYSLSSTSETSEATNSPDVILSMLAKTENNSRFTEVNMQVLKYRDGETANGITVETDYATSYFRSRSVPGMSSFQAYGSSSANIFDAGNFDGLLDH